MNLSILEQLKNGETFDFPTLANNLEQADQFWDWWWKNKVTPGIITIPELIAETDPILTQTVEKPSADLISNQNLFNRILLARVFHGEIPMERHVRRENFREKLLQLVFNNNSEQLSGRPQVVFTGGGIASGKTLIASDLALQGSLPIGLKNQIGVDVFATLIPEYNQISAVGDGRANQTVNRECQTLASELYARLIKNGRSFILDSTMSDQVETMRKIKMAQAANYELTLLAVLTPLEQARLQAIHRAKKSRRFANGERMERSHFAFRQAFNSYLPEFDEVLVFANNAKICDLPLIIAEKNGRENALDIKDSHLLESGLQ